jgi:Cof subfamily protein (haloacid dehalogenase superfamily)
VNDSDPVIRLVATDIDGTLLTPGNELTERTKRILGEIRSLGVDFTFVTGLNPWVTQRLVADVGPWANAVCLNGIFTLEDGRPVPGRFVDPQVAREAVSLVLDHGYVPLVYGEDQVSRYLPGNAGAMAEITKLIAERPFQPYTGVSTVEELLAVRPAQVSVCDTPERGAALSPVLQSGLGDRAYVVHQPGERTWVEVNHPDARKDLGLLALAEKLGLAAEEVLYFGDSLNDMPVFETFPYTVAVENARPEVKALAWRTTKSNAEDGVAAFLATWFGLAFD